MTQPSTDHSVLNGDLTCCFRLGFVLADRIGANSIDRRPPVAAVSPRCPEWQPLNTATADVSNAIRVTNPDEYSLDF